MSEVVDVLGYFAFFWLFVFNARFRRAQIEEWAGGGLIERAGLVFEATVSFLFGVIVPLALLAYLAGSP
ncbi:hypothetical protein ACG02S_11915 [Roseateles sp. DC23W]|uniref:Uncharacterized protein n=1 Tax=Pelomonas dachongensis TaxID=3299029 RepID=A0ABW7EN33_9BURK